MKRRATFVLAAAAAVTGCQKDPPPSDQFGKSVEPHGSGAGVAKPKSEQLAPPVDLKTPPADATKTASGLVYKKLQANAAGAAIGKNDTVLVTYTGWHQATGETFFTNRTAGAAPVAMSLAATPAGFTEGFQLLKKGERAVFWMPPNIGYKVPPPQPETNVYEMEITDVEPAPAVPADVAAPAAGAQATKNGTKYVVVRAGTGKDTAKPYDNVTFQYTAWDAEGRMFDTTEMKKKAAPAKQQPYRSAPPIAEILETMIAGERVRFWTDADHMQEKGKPPLPNLPKGSICYELELLTLEPGVEPPLTPPDVAKPPADAKKTPKGTFYKLLKAGKGGPHPAPTDTVKVHYSGWTTDGKMFDSSVTRGTPAEFSLQGVVAGWTDGIPMMAVGDKMRFWIPEELAYKGAPGKPQGMLVFDVDLLEIKPAAHPDMPPSPHHP